MLGAVLGCSGPEHPSYIDTTNEQGARGGRPATGHGGGENGGSENGGGGAAAIAGDGGERPSMPTEPPAEGGYFDPEQVYVIGTLKTALAYVDVVTAHNDSKHYTAGFPESATAVPPGFLNGRLVYGTDDGLRVYNPDYRGSASFADDKYPQNTERNDSIIETPACPKTQSFRAGAGRLLYHCADEGWFEGSEKIMAGTEIRAIGYDDWVFLDHGDGILNLATGESHALPAEFFHGAVWAIRPSKKGFYYVTESDLLEIDAAGNVEVVGTYPDAPEGYRYHYAVGAMQIAGDLALIQHAYFRARPDAVSTDVIIRRELDGDATEVFSNADGGPVYYWGGDLFTGP